MSVNGDRIIIGAPHSFKADWPGTGGLGSSRKESGRQVMFLGVESTIPMIIANVPDRFLPEGIKEGDEIEIVKR